MSNMPKPTNEVKLSSDRITEALGEGYVRGVPPWCPQVRAIDAPIAQSEPCESCGQAVLYVALHHRQRRSYRAFAQCTACGAASEF
jgi:hypothetical protein